MAIILPRGVLFRGGAEDARQLVLWQAEPSTANDLS